MIWSFCARLVFLIQHLQHHLFEESDPRILLSQQLYLQIRNASTPHLPPDSSPENDQEILRASRYRHRHLIDRILEEWTFSSLESKGD